MKKLFILLCVTGLSICVITFDAPAAAPTTTCPAGYAAVNSAIRIVNDSCSGNSQPVKIFGADDNPTTCLVASPSGVCFMYAPADTNFTDPSGTYQFSQICPLS